MAFATVEEYLASFSDEERTILERVRTSILAAIPGAEERISYGIVRLEAAGCHPIYFGGWKTHVGMYPVPALAEPLEQQIAKYRSSKDSLHFPFTDAVPYDLITQVTSAVAERG